MSQYDLDLTGNNSGLDLIDALDQSMAAMHSGHIGPSRPSYATEGMIWTKQGAKPQLMYFNGTSDVVLCDLDRPLAEQLATPSGAIMMWSGSVVSIPAGWLLCDGSNGTPDLRDRFIIGAGGGLNPNQTGGTAQVTLTTGNLPSHGHGAGSLQAQNGGGHTPSGVTSTAGDHDHALAGVSVSGGNWSIQYTYHEHLNGDAISNDSRTGRAGNHAHNLNMDAVADHTHTIGGATANTGGGQAFDNRPPYLALCFIMKV